MTSVKLNAILSAIIILLLLFLWLELLSFEMNIYEFQLNACKKLCPKPAYPEMPEQPETPEFNPTLILRQSTADTVVKSKMKSELIIFI